MKDMEIRTVAGIEARESDGGLKIVGHAAVFDSRSMDLGGFVEVVKPGAFARTLSENPRVHANVEHRSGLATLGSTGGGTLRLSEDSRGLRAEIDLPDTQAGRDAFQLVKRGDLDAMSFAFQTRKDQWDMGVSPPLRSLLDVDLDGGDVTLTASPAYRETSVAIRSREGAEMALLGEVKSRERGRELEL